MKSNKHYEGLGYYIPMGYTKTQVKELFKQWNTKLKKSGHNDVEHFSELGKSSIYFISDKKKSIYIKSNYNLETYYNLIQTYMHLYFESDLGRRRFKRNYNFIRLLMRDHVQGIALTKTTEYVKHLSWYKLDESDKPNQYCHSLNYKRSKFYIYITIRAVLNHCWIWHLTDINGELNAQELQHYNFLGLDVPNTERYINEILVAKGLETIKLRLPESKLYSYDTCCKID